MKQLNNQKISKQELLDEIKILANHYIVNFPIAQTLTTVDVLLSHCMDWIDLMNRSILSSPSSDFALEPDLTNLTICFRDNFRTAV